MIGPRARAGLVLLCVFAAGALSGVFFERHHSFRASPSMSATEEHEAALAELRDAVGLDDRQLEQIHAVLAERQRIVQHMWEQLRPEVQSAMREVHSEIAGLLRPEQLERFHAWLAQRRDQGEAPRH